MKLWQWLVVYSTCSRLDSTYISACGLVNAETEEQAKEFASKNARKNIEAVRSNDSEQWKVYVPSVYEVKKYNIETVPTMEIPR